MTPADLFMSYTRGWSDGACCRFERLEFVTHKNHRIVSSYRAGYADGMTARGKATAAAMKRFKYKPNILRAMKKPKVFS